MNTGTIERRRALSRLGRNDGAQLVEFAFVAPVLLLLLFGIIEFGVMIYDQAVITNASREGARYYTMFPANSAVPPSEGQVKTYVQTYVANKVISLVSPVPTPGVSFPAAASGYVAVQVSYPYDFLVFGSLINLFGGSITNPVPLTATTVMQNEN